MLWIDGVGGYLVCLNPRVTIGQVNMEAPADIALLADISRLHATIQRDAEGYFLETHRPVQVNGRMVNKALLRSGDRLTLGTSCQMAFTQAVPVSPSARLEVTSGHRLLKPVDAVLLMAETLILGAPPQCHVAIPDLEKPIILYRNRDRLSVRYDGKFQIDGHDQSERGQLTGAHRVTAGGVTMYME